MKGAAQNWQSIHSCTNLIAEEMRGEKVKYNSLGVVLDFFIREAGLLKTVRSIKNCELMDKKCKLRFSG